MNPAATLMVCKWLRDRLTGWETAAKRDLGLLAGERKAAVIDGLVLGHVSMVKGRTTTRVANDTALLAFVKAHHPTEVEVHEQIRPSFLKKLLDDAKTVGAQLDSDGVVIDGLIEVGQGDPYPMCKPAPDADIAVAGLLKRGQLGVDGLTAIEAAP